MSIATVVTRGYGSFGSIAEVVTRGYTIGEVVVADIDTHSVVWAVAEDRAVAGVKFDSVVGTKPEHRFVRGRRR